MQIYISIENWSIAENVVNTFGATNVVKSEREDLDFYQTPSGAT